MDLLEVRDTESGEDTIAFIDNMLLLARGKTLAEANDKVKGMMEWAGNGHEFRMGNRVGLDPSSPRVMRSSLLAAMFY